MGVKITSIGRYLPEKVLTNDDLSKFIDTSDEWISSRTGIKERRIASEEETTSHLAIKAAKKVLNKRRLDSKEIDLIIVSTMMGDSPFPSVACKVQEAIGATNAGAFDISAACSGFVYAIETASQFVQTGYIKKCLVIGAEVFSKFLDWEERSTCVLFGDGAGAILLEHSDENTFYGGVLRADGSGENLLHMVAGGTYKPASIETVNNREHFLRMKGLELFQAVVPIICDVALETCEKTGMELNDIDLIIPHQANVHIIEQVAMTLDIPFERFFINIEKYGNTSAASIPIALYDALRKGKIKPGYKIMMIGFGAGLTCAANIIEWTDNCVY
ncbi:beta-ketoacyl-ACP synthase III [Priestia aryabhattai]|uniref:beta-ketoacyl-ACP synthase III n=1 Tax=Priestia megaterium TaxID=1404 RepID=UPI0039B989BD